MSYLQVTGEQVEEINGQLSAAGVPHRVRPETDNDDALLLGVDLLEDKETNYLAAKVILESLPIVERSPGDFPTPISSE